MINKPHESVPSDAMEGVVDGLSGQSLRGWACHHGEGQPPLHIEVRNGDMLLGTGDAAMFRADLAAAGKREGHCAFAIMLDPPPSPGTVLSVTALDRHLAGSPYIVPEPSVADEASQFTDILPLPIYAARLHGSLDQCGPVAIRGWARWLDGSGHPPMLALHEGNRELLRFEPIQWRADIAELQQEDGCCGFDLPLPADLCDGQLHVFDLRFADGGASVLQMPFRARVAAPPRAPTATRAQGPEPLQRTPSGDRLTLSVLVNFYNMQREAARTLASLGHDYQQGTADLDYEVLCIDNGSEPPLDPDWVASFGPQFRLIRPSRRLASPCAALNEAALQARGDYLAVMIDGAHLLTPGVFREARAAWREHADAVIAVRHWFIGGDQRWLALAGYTREQENQLFERIRWPANGYDLFRIGAPIGENPEPWFDGLSESNSLMLPAALFDRIGGFDEAFNQAGGGFANLDLWRRASNAADGPLVSLVGEASFHQFHDGTTTNVDDAEKDLRVRSYANAYRALRGEDFAGVHRSRLSFRGRMPSEFATGVRQRTLLPMRLGITERIRPGQLALHFDDGAQNHLQSVYAECGLQHAVTWLGQPTGVAPADLVSLQQIVHLLRPDAIVLAGAEAGLVAFIDSMLLATENPAARILHVDPRAVAAATPPAARITALHGSPGDPSVLATARHWAGSAETVLVLYAANPDAAFSSATLQAWGKLVSYRSWLVCPGTLFGQPWLGYSTHQHLQAIREFASGDPSFVIDRSWNRQLISTCPSGFLRKVGGTVTATNYNAALDDLVPARHALLEHAR
ncbi:MAG: CmcI family methyltransferase [Rhodanobacter sp.]